MSRKIPRFEAKQGIEGKSNYRRIRETMTAF